MPRKKKGQASPRGARTNRGSRGGGRGGTPRTRGRYPSGLTSMSRPENLAGFTLADEARQTSQHDHSDWSRSNLRLKPVTFVSAGTSEPLKQLDELLEQGDRAPSAQYVADPNQDDPHASPTLLEGYKEDGDEEDGEEEEQSPEEVIGPEELEAEIQPDPTIIAEPAFFYDLTGDKPEPQRSADAVPIPERPPSSSSSSSSEEIILFKGRDAQRKSKVTIPNPLAQTHQGMEVVQEEILVTRRSSAFVSDASRNQRRRRPPRRRAGLDQDDDILADYIANMRENGETDDLLQQFCNRRDLGGTDSDANSDSSIDNEHDSPKAEKDLELHEGHDTEEEKLDNETESELDDETLAKLIAGQELGLEDNARFPQSSSDSDSSDDEKVAEKQTITQEDFDLMDWSRPSLRRRKGKGTRAQMNFDVSDSELERTLQAAWKSDRLKKAERKKQREELRALGMLGKKANPEDLRVKYPVGMDMEQVAEELRDFLLSSDESLALPPMDNHARKMIHDLASKFKIKSKSTGKADQRRPVLYRTVRTLPYVESTFDQAFARVTRRYLPRLDVKGKRSQRPPQNRSSVAAASYQDGEIVGAAAPELGVENRGRAMLEKMGWSSGTALGAMNNKGILQPVTHAMKRSKAGLG